jgi:hypothetical protein
VGFWRRVGVSTVLNKAYGNSPSKSKLGGQKTAGFLGKFYLSAVFQSIVVQT